ncbi:hypothetical protein ACFWBC_01835 [Streptomyces sp. NPDC059985]|uniref:hypothetical protein n=1 Tax=Streptomyces sp. NPDC059985 TaxID=3347025 RepID=UPI0036CCC9CB
MNDPNPEYHPIFDTQQGIAVLERVVEHYTDVFLPCEKKDRKYYRGLTTKKAARDAGRLRRHDNQRHSHADSWAGKTGPRKAEDALDRFSEALKQYAGKLYEGMPFLELHDVVEEAALRAGSPKPEPLLRYDAALMLAWHLRTEPEDVWLHSGTDWGVRTLGISTKGRKIVTLDELPTTFRKLPAWQVEDILCIYRLVIQQVHGDQPVDAKVFAKIEAKRQQMGCGHRRCKVSC